MSLHKQGFCNAEGKRALQLIVRPRHGTDAQMLPNKVDTMKGAIHEQLGHSSVNRAAQAAALLSYGTRFIHQQQHQ